MAGPVHAQDTGRIDAIQAQISQLQQELKHIRSDLAARDREVRAAHEEAAQARASAQRSAGQINQVQATIAALPPPTGFAAPQQTAAAEPAKPSGPSGSFHVGGVTVTLGGFLAAEGVYRTRNNVADIGSNFNTIPLAQSPNYHTGEFRGTARQSRLSLLAEGTISDSEKVTGYYESDFLGVGTTSNSVESNSYAPRLRQAYLTYDNSALGVHVLAGQAWSMLTLNKVGITPRQEDIPLTIDAQYVPGFDWKRQWQLRIDKDLLNKTVWLGASLEEPQSTYYTGPNGLGVASGTTTITNPGGSQLNSTATYSDDIAPDLIAKAAFDPGWGHYEVYGLGRLFHDRQSFAGGGHNNTVVAGAGGAGMVLPLIPKVLDFQVSGLAGVGIGSYGSGQLPRRDRVAGRRPPGRCRHITCSPAWSAIPRPNTTSMAMSAPSGCSATPSTPAARPMAMGIHFTPMAAAIRRGSASATCVGNTSRITQGTIGGWWRFLHGNYGTVSAGAQYSYTRRSIFSGGGTASNTSATPSTDDNIVLFSMRYAPFQ